MIKKMPLLEAPAIIYWPVESTAHACQLSVDVALPSGVTDQEKFVKL